MKYIAIVLTLFTFVACSNTVTIADLFAKEGCSGPCYKRMGCEGQEVTVRIPLDGTNVLPNGRVMFVKDQDDPQKTIKVEFDASIPETLIQDFKANIGQTAFVTGHIEGYDLLNPTSCKRAHTIYVSKVEDVQFD